MYYESELYHHGIKGQKWGVRRWQNADGTFNEAGKKRYFNSDGTLNEKGTKVQAKLEYKNKKSDINKRRNEINEAYDKKQDANKWGLDSGSLSNRVKNHIRNEYEREQALNKLDQERLNAKREYREKLGKKTDTLLMKNYQKAINEISNESIDDFTRGYVGDIASESFAKASQYYNDHYKNYYRG